MHQSHQDNHLVQVHSLMANRPDFRRMVLQELVSAKTLSRFTSLMHQAII